MGQSGPLFHLFISFSFVFNLLLIELQDLKNG